MNARGNVRKICGFINGASADATTRKVNYTIYFCKIRLFINLIVIITTVG